jgi:hypothetical protein
VSESPEISDEAVEAYKRGYQAWRYPGDQPPWQVTPEMRRQAREEPIRAGLAAVYPVLAQQRVREREIQVRVDVAEEIAAAIEARLATAKATHYRAALAKAAEIAREHRLPPGVYEIGGAVVIEPKKMDSMLSVRLDSDLVAKLREIAARREMGISDLLREGAELVIEKYAVEPEGEGITHA